MQTHIDNWHRWRAECARVLYGNLPDFQIQLRLPYRFTSPAREKGKYLPQWLWDSCFHALAYRHFDTQMAWEELLALTVHQVPADQTDAGMIPHMQHLNVVGDTSAQQLFRHPQRSNITQPPLIAVAALRVYEKDTQPDYLRTLYEANARHHAWLDRRRADGDGLVAIIHPWEAGWDASQRWDDLMGVTAALANGADFAAVMQQLKQTRWRMMQDIAFHHADVRALRDAGHFYVKPVDFNAIRAADLRAMAQIAQILGEDPTGYEAKADHIAQTMRQKFIRQEGMNLHISDLIYSNEGETRSSVDSAAKFVLLFGQCVDNDVAMRLRDEIMGVTGAYHTPFMVPTTPTDALTFDSGEYWRGNVWLAINWLIYSGLRAYGYVNDARKLAENSLQLVQHSGFYEFFDSISGAGGQALGVTAPQNQSWTTIVLDMLASERQAGL